MKKSTSKIAPKAQPKIGILDFLLGFIAATALSDWVFQPLLEAPDGSAYGRKLVSWLAGTVIFLLIAGLVIFGSVTLRYMLKKNR